MQGSFEHLHILFPIDYKWVKRDSNILCAKEEELFKGTTGPPNKLDSHRLQLFQVPLCAISSSYCSSCSILATVAAYVVACGEREDDAATLV